MYNINVTIQNKTDEGGEIPEKEDACVAIP